MQAEKEAAGGHWRRWCRTACCESTAAVAPRSPGSGPKQAKRHPEAQAVWPSTAKGVPACATSAHAATKTGGGAQALVATGATTSAGGASMHEQHA